ncbi:putative endonuclease 4 [Planctomycetales bacterium]|nr:putative endonuclease 4 [Planctomycetales bacterium]GHT02295.1 putative endonuclease 4 [Planctomycetales bacterium]
MLNLGYHASSARGYLAMGEEARSVGANTLQFFSRNPRGSNQRPFNADDAAALRRFLLDRHFAPVLAHAPYTLNACAADAGLRDLAQRMMSEDLERLDFLPDGLYVFHPGSHVKQGVATGVKLIAETLNAALTPHQKTTVLLETMAGKGTEVGGNFAELRAVLDRVKHPEKVGVCWDTCHLYSAGYDIVNKLDEVIGAFDREIGLGKLRAAHLNDSMKPFGGHQDRHARIGDGTLGLTAVVNFITHEKLRHLPFFLETPNDLAGYAAEIKLLREKFAAAGKSS